MKTAFIVIIIVCTLKIGWCQNLVPNNSFEAIQSCPTSEGQLYLAYPWAMPPNVGLATSDLFNVCSGNNIVGIPTNAVGYQNPNTGSGYAGIYVYGSSNIREYLQIQLFSSLVAGVTYKTEMYVSPGNFPGIAVNSIGIHFSIGAISGSGVSAPLSYIPQIQNPLNSFISDTSVWTLISGDYTATGGENFITIGNFQDDSTTDTMIYTSPSWNRGYYLVDDVSISILTKLNEVSVDERIDVFPNPFSDIINIDSQNNISTHFSLCNIIGKCIIETQFINFVSLNVDYLSAGVYFYSISNKSGVLKQGKIIKL